MKDCNETRLQQAATEKDPDKLALLMREFDLMLEERQRQLKGKAPAATPSSQPLVSSQQQKKA